MQKPQSVSSSSQESVGSFGNGRRRRRSSISQTSAFYRRRANRERMSQQASSLNGLSIDEESEEIIKNDCRRRRLYIPLVRYNEGRRSSLPSLPVSDNMQGMFVRLIPLDLSEWTSLPTVMPSSSSTSSVLS